MSELPITRRDLVRTIALAAPCACLARDTDRCCAVPDAPTAGVAIRPGLVTIDLEHVPELHKTGNAVRIIDESRKLFLLVAHPEKDRYVALNQKCTHGGGSLTYIHKLRLLHCTCWGHSRFGLDGQVLYWPNKQQGRPLGVHKVAVRGKTLDIEVEGLA